MGQTVLNFSLLLTAYYNNNVCFRRFSQVEVTTLMDLNRLLNFAVFYGVHSRLLVTFFYPPISSLNLYLIVKMTGRDRQSSHESDQHRSESRGDLGHRYDRC